MNDQLIRIETATEFEQFERCIELQKMVWGYGEDDILPRKMFLIASRIGGQVLGAFRGETMIGFAMALPGYRDGRPYLHSHMLAVLPEFRDGGIGRRLKLAQRDDALRRGFDLMEWTFDPLEIKNAHLNISRLGAVCRRYQKDFYGPSSSPLQGGLPTDRLYAEWWLRSDRVESLLGAETKSAPGSGSEVVQRVSIPASIYAWKSDVDRRHLALDLQTRTREALEAGFREGLTVIGYERDPEGNGSYLLGRWSVP